MSSLNAQCRPLDPIEIFNLDDGWTKYRVPHRSSPYYYHAELKLIADHYTLDDQSNRVKFLKKHKKVAKKNNPREVFVDIGGRRILVIDHQAEMVQENEVEGKPPASSSEIRRRADYWIYLHNFPCHYLLPESAVGRGFHILEIMMAHNLTNPGGGAWKPFTTQDIGQYSAFLEFSERMVNAGRASMGSAFARSIVISKIMDKYYNRRLKNHDNDKHVSSSGSSPHWEMFIACLGMPPSYGPRFKAAHATYRDTLKPTEWLTYISQVRKERDTMNIISGLLLASSLAFLAVPGLVDVAQCFIVLSIGLSLASVVMGFNGIFEKNLLDLEDFGHTLTEEDNTQLNAIGVAMKEHYTVLLLSVMFFFFSIMGYATYSIFTSAFAARSVTFPYVWFVVSTFGLLVTLGMIFRWNHRLTYARRIQDLEKQK